MKFLILLSLFIGSATYAETQILCPERYPNGNRLIEGNILRYENGNRLIDGDVWRYDNGNRLIDGDVWRYKNGNRLIDGDVWRYENGNRVLDGDVVRYPNGNRLREPDGTFRSQNGTVIGGDYLEYAFSTSDGTTIIFQFTKTSEAFDIVLESFGHFYEISLSEESLPQPEKLKCRINNTEAMSFRLNSSVASAEVTVHAGYEPSRVKAVLEKALDSLAAE